MFCVSAKIFICLLSVTHCLYYVLHLRILLNYLLLSVCNSFSHESRNWSNRLAVTVAIECIVSVFRERLSYDAHLFIFYKYLLLIKQSSTLKVKKVHECKYMKHIFELRMKDQIEERSSQLLRNLSSCEEKACEKNSGLNGIRTHDLCDAGAVLYQLSYPSNWELVILWVRNIPVKYE